MAQVGIAPFCPEPNQEVTTGDIIQMGEARFQVMEETTKEAFLARIHEIGGWSPDKWQDIPPKARFFKISTD